MRLLSHNRIKKPKKVMERVRHRLPVGGEDICFIHKSSLLLRFLKRVWCITMLSHLLPGCAKYSHLTDHNVQKCYGQPYQHVISNQSAESGCGTFYFCLLILWKKRLEIMTVTRPGSNRLQSKSGAGSCLAIKITNASLFHEP